MTENTMMNDKDNLTTNTKPTAKTFGKAFENVVLFPFRAVKFLIKWGFRTVVVLFVTMNLFFAIKAASPMDLPEAKGMTYYQLLGERADKFMNYKKNDNYVYLVTRFVGYPVAFYFGDTYRRLVATFYPEGKADLWLKNHNHDGTYEFNRLRGDAKLTNLPNLLWELNERTSWVWFVVYEKNIPYPQLPTNK
jgi:hypothetical protein